MSAADDPFRKELMMDMCVERWPECGLAAPNWVGRIEVEEKMTLPGFCAEVGLSKDEWLPVGFAFSKAGGKLLTEMFAVRHDAVVGDSAALPVASFLFHELSAEDVLMLLAHDVEIALKHRRFAQLPFEVVERFDIPVQPD